jgi:CheY-like chemotaxis protein
MDAPKRILIVDDEPHVRLVFRTALEVSGYLVTEAADGDAALAQLRKLPTDLILLDLKMPVVDGRETLRLLRDAGDETPVVIITAHGSVPDAVAAMKLGAVGFPAQAGQPRDLASRGLCALLCRASGGQDACGCSGASSPVRGGPRSNPMGHGTSRVRRCRVLPAHRRRTQARLAGSHPVAGNSPLPQASSRGFLLPCPGRPAAMRVDGRTDSLSGRVVRRGCYRRS